MVKIAVHLRLLIIVSVSCALVCHSNTYAEAPTNGLVAHYEFNNSYLDLTGSGQQAIPFNTDKVAFIYDSIVDRAVLSLIGDGFLGGLGGYIRLPRPLGLGTTATFSIAVLELGYSYHHGQDLIHVQNGQLGLIGHRWFAGEGDSGLYTMNIKVGNELPSVSYNATDGSVTINNPQWTSYQIVSDAGMTQLYKNGDIVAAVSASLPSDGDVYLNYADFGNYSTRVTANYADIRIYDRALSSTEVKDLATAIIPEPSTYALLLLSGAASLWALKRRKS